MTSVICPTCGAACSLGGETTRYFIPPKDESERIVDLQRQLAEAKAEIEADDRNVNNLMDQVHEMSKEIEAMRPMVEACKESFDRHSTDRERILPCQCLTCQWYRDYLGRKQP